LLGTGTFIYEFLNSRLQANIEFLQQNNRVNVLSNPMVLASNHREAELFIGEETLLTEGFTYFQPSVIGNSNFVQPGYIEADIVREDIGITLRITPRINTDETVTLELEQESSTVNVGGGTIPVSDSNGGVMNLAVDTVNTSRLTGTVVAHNNLTVAVGGLIRTSKSTQQRKVPILGEIPVLGRIFRSDIESEEDTETVLLITPRILNKANESENIRKTDNRFYQDLNRGHPETQPAPNKFIDKAKPNNVTNQSQSNSNMTRQNVYLSMSQYAAETVRIPEIERVKSATYSPVRVSSEPVSFIFDDNAIMAKPIASWQRGGMYVTAIQVLNNSQQSKAVPYQSIKGKWLASSIEQNNLAPYGQNNDRTFLYLVSALSFEESINYAQ
jgi:general secretion pathway protein D